MHLSCSGSFFSHVFSTLIWSYIILYTLYLIMSGVMNKCYHFYYYGKNNLMLGTFSTTVLNKSIRIKQEIMLARWAAETGINRMLQAHLSTQFHKAVKVTYGHRAYVYIYQPYQLSVKLISKGSWYQRFTNYLPYT